MQPSLLSPIRFGINDEVTTLFSRHYFEHILINETAYQNFDASEQIAAIEKIIEAESFRNEADVEEQVIRPIFRVLDLKYKVQTSLNGKSVDYAIYDGEAFDENYTNTVIVVEAEAHHKLKKRYFIKKQDNSDPIAQIRNYLRGVNELLANTTDSKSIDFGLLTDGVRWRIYSRKFTHNDKDFEQNFLEFNLEEIRALKDEQQRHYLKLFCYLFSLEGLTKHIGVTAAE
jgi:hypothetical protein